MEARPLVKHKMAILVVIQIAIVCREIVMVVIVLLILPCRISRF